jgi:hypothetical protein
MRIKAAGVARENELIKDKLQTMLENLKYMSQANEIKKQVIADLTEDNHKLKQQLE